MSTGHRCDAEDRGLHDTKVSDSGYSNSCSNSQSQRSSGSSESRHSSSSGSSGYCGHQTAPPSNQAQTNIIDSEQQSQLGGAGKREDKKKKNKGQQESGSSAAEGVAKSGTTANPASPQPTIPAPDTAHNQSTTSPNSTAEHITNNVGFVTPSTSPRVGSSPVRQPQTEALQIAALAQTFTCIKKYACKEANITDDPETSLPPKAIDPAYREQQIINSLEVEPLHEEELYVVVSLKDGIVLYTTPNITQLLGFPKDMWIGRSLIDFVHPKHRVAFASHITSIIANPVPTETNSVNVGAAGGNGGGGSAFNGKRGSGGNSFFCCLRQYRGLMSAGFTVTDKRVGYLPCQLTTTFKELHNLGLNHSLNFNLGGVNSGRTPGKEAEAPQAAANCVFLVITATAVRSAYKFGDEVKAPVKFMMRHLANCQVSHVDAEVMPYFGYLPQDMINRSVFDYYHPEDLRSIKEGYQSVMKEQGHPVKSKPYRFRCQNGGFALVETELSAFVNPWSRKLEFVISQHTVLKGPQNPDVTTPVNDPDPVQVTEELLKESKGLQEEIKCLLSETVAHPTETVKQQVSKRCKDLATFMEALMDTKPHDLKVDVLTEDHSFSERDSVMLGEISPHHDYYNSKSSSETPPSYNQLNYNENLQRFFESKPKTTLSDESGDMKMAEEGVAAMLGVRTPALSSGGEEGKTSPIVNSSDDANSGQRACCFGDNMGGSGTSSGQSIESNSGGGGGDKAVGGTAPDVGGAVMPAAPKPASSSAAVSNHREPLNMTTSNGLINGGSYKPLTLTEQLLSKHNEDMEKQMMQKHRELRSKGEGKNKDRHKTPYDKMQDDGGGGHGVKRSGSHSWEGEPYKSMKQTHTEAGATAGGATLGVGLGTISLGVCGGAGGGHGVGGPSSSSHQTLPPMSSHQTLPPMSSVASGAPHHQAHRQRGGHHHQPHPKQQHQQQPAKVNLWPPFSVGITPLHTTPPNFTTPTLASPIVPMFYVPEPPRVPPDTRAYQHNTAPTYITQQVPYVPGMLYHPLAMFAGAPPPVVYSPMSVVQPQCGLAVQHNPSARPQHHQRNHHFVPHRQSHHHTAPLKTPQVLAPNKMKSSMANSLLAPNMIGCSYVDKKQADPDGDSNETSNAFDDSSNYSSFYSFLKTDKSDDSMKSSPEHDMKSEEMVWEKSERQGTSRPIKKVAPWLEDINVTSDLLLKYQLRERHLKDVLEEDFKALERLTQPSMVNDQLSQMYLDLELEGLSKQLTLEEGITSSSDSSGEDTTMTPLEYKKKRYMEYDKMVIIFEENAPLPPPPAVQPTPCN